MSKYYHLKRQIREHPLIEQVVGTYRYITLYSCFARYVRKFLSITIEAVFLLFGVYLVCLGLLYLSYMMWELYQQTPMGREFVNLFDHKTHVINKLMGLDFWHFAWEITITSFMVCVTVSAAAWLSHIGRILYLPLSAPAKLFFWGLPLSAAVAFYLYTVTGFSNSAILFTVAAVPTLCLFMSCFQYTERLLPECSDIVVEGVRITRECKDYLKDKIG